MATSFAPPPSSTYTVPSLKYYFSPATFKEVGHPHSRPSSSSSSSSYGNDLSSSTPNLFGPSDYTRFRSASELTVSAAHDKHALNRQTRPLPTPPTTPQSTRSSLPPRPLPDPPLHRAQSTEHFRATPLPTPPASGSRTPPLPPTPPAEAGPSTPRRSISHHAHPSVSSERRPSIHLDITATEKPALSHYLPTPCPLSPLAFDLPGSRDLRRRREQELDRRMKALGFVESPRSPRQNTVPDAESLSHERKFSLSSVETDREVVLLVDHEESDVEEAEPEPRPEPEPKPELERPPTRSQSRAAMIVLFSGQEEHADDRYDASGRTARLPSVKERDNESLASSVSGIQVDVEVEVVTKAVERTKRRFSRKWIRERKGKRYTEQDFSEIISQLRKLR